MNERNRNHEESLDRLFQSAGPSSAPVLDPDPYLPARIRTLAAAGATTRTPVRAPRWAWVSFASAAVALCLFAGGYIGYRAWEFTRQNADESTGEAEVLLAAWSQSGFVEGLSGLDSDSEVQE